MLIGRTTANRFLYIGRGSVGLLKFRLNSKIYPKCIIRGNLSEVRRQLTAGLPPDAAKEGLLLTQWAVKSGQLDILKLLLQSGGDVNKQNSQGRVFKD